MNKLVEIRFMGPILVENHGSPKLVTGSQNKFV